MFKAHQLLPYSSELDSQSSGLSKFYTVTPFVMSMFSVLRTLYIKSTEIIQEAIGAFWFKIITSL